MAFDIEMIKKVYDRMPERVDQARKLLGRPLTLTEKILYAHLWDALPATAFVRGKDYVDFALTVSLVRMLLLKWHSYSSCMPANPKWLYLLLYTVTTLFKPKKAPK